MESRTGARQRLFRFSDQIDAENIASRWAVERREAGMLIGGIVDRPSWMLAGINTVKLTAIHRYVVHVTRARHELHHLDDLTCLDVVLDEAWSVTLIAGGAFLLMSCHLPDEAVVIGDAVQPFGEAWHVRRWEHVIDFPSLGIDADQRFKAISIDPDFADVSLPCHAVRGAAIVFGPEWNLSVADLLAVHVGLEYPINRRSGVLYL